MYASWQSNENRINSVNQFVGRKGLAIAFLSISSLVRRKIKHLLLLEQKAAGNAWFQVVRYIAKKKTNFVKRNITQLYNIEFTPLNGSY